LLRVTPDDAEAHFQLARLLARQRRPAEALAHYRETLRLKPDWPEARNNLAWLLATLPHSELRGGTEAVLLAERACAETGRSKAVFLGTLAAAYAEAGRFADAVKTASEAEELAQAGGEKALTVALLKLRGLYSESKPYRESGP
jgi:Flp pilus assembly protein TadD